MKRIGTSVALALLFISVLGFTAFSQQSKSDEVEVQILEGGISQELPVDVTLLVSTTTGVQTVTVPLKLNINLTIGPVDAVDMSVDIQGGTQFVSPVSTVKSVEDEEAEDEEAEDKASDEDEDAKSEDEDEDEKSEDDDAEDEDEDAEDEDKKSDDDDAEEEDEDDDDKASDG